MATREVSNKLGKQRQYRKGRDHECDETESGCFVSKRRRMNSDFVERWDAAALKVILFKQFEFDGFLRGQQIKIFE